MAGVLGAEPGQIVFTAGGTEADNLAAAMDRGLAALEADHEFLLEGEVFTADLISTYVDYKRSAEIDPIRLRPHPASATAIRARAAQVRG